ncbi:hypothetical protein Leryth_020627, partial [Lithospermum erythrorhizon]
MNFNIMLLNKLTHITYPREIETITLFHTINKHIDNLNLKLIDNEFQIMLRYCLT